MALTQRHILFLCTGNSARSILAEAITNALGDGRWLAHSAGSRPGGVVHPQALRTLEAMGISTAGLRSKSWDEFAVDGVPTMDVVVTVCDRAADEVCPIWPGAPVTAHWGLPDPAAVQGSEDEVAHAFSVTAVSLKRRIERLLALPTGVADQRTLERGVRSIGVE